VRGRARRWGRRLMALTALAVAGAAAAYGPALLRRVDAFQVRQVEVVGTRFLDPYTVVRAAGLDTEASVFDDPARWVSGVRTLSLVEDVAVTRTLPGTLTLEVREVEPVALVAGETLRPVDADGRLLELDPAGTGLDLPILTGVRVAGPGLEPGPSAVAAATVAALHRRAPEVAERVSQIDRVGTALRLEFRDGKAQALIPVSASPVQLTQLRLALADLMARGELGQVRTIDVRFRDQVVVSFLDAPVI
jgi:cell division protein FtsQ